MAANKRFNGLLAKSSNQTAKLDDGAFSEMPGGRPSSFHGVTEWGTRWPRAKARGTARGEACPPIREP